MATTKADRPSADVILHPNPSPPRRSRNARNELLAVVDAARTAGVLRCVLIGECADGEVVVFSSPSVTNAHTTGLLSEGVEKWANAGHEETAEE